MKIAVIGAGPAGLYFSLLAKKNNPQHEITVYEQNRRGATYGWGVVFSDIGLAFLEDADPEFFKEFTDHHECCDYMEIVHQDSRVQVHGNHFSRTSRIDMLNTLNTACEAIGIEIQYEHQMLDIETLSQQVDLVVAADGGNSAIRKQYQAHFQPQFEQRRNKFVWYGTRQRFHPVSLIFRPYHDAGVFIAHAYQYSSELSTFLVEVDPETWKACGLDQMNEDESRDFCAKVFARDLGGNELLTNRSLWFEANIVKNQCWTYKNIVLLGDALRTVHFSLGSGTRMAMQDAIALHEAIVKAPDDLALAFQLFEQQRRHASSSFQTAAVKSLDWYENVATRLDLDPISFTYDYMRRTGKVSHQDLKQRDPQFIAAYERLHPDFND